MNNTGSIKLWDDIHKNKEWISDSNYPSTNALAFIRHHLNFNKERSEIKILDVGCGTGASTIAFAKAGYKVYAIDSSAKAIDDAIKNSNISGIKINFQLADFHNLPFEDNEFDAVFSEGVLYYGDKSDFMVGNAEIYRVLKSGGIARIYTKSNRDFWVSEGKFISENTYLVSADTWEKGLQIFCPSLKEIQEIYQAYKKITIGIDEFNFIGIEKLHSFWVITCEK